MTVAELFINIGLKGSETVGKTLSGVQTGLKNIASSSIEAKAGVLAVVYGIERMTATAGENGANLVKFATLAGVSAEKLQGLQNIFRQVGVSAETVQGTFYKLQDVVTNFRLNKGVPEYFKLFSGAVGGLDVEKLKGKNGIFYLLEKISEFSKKGDPAIMRKLTEGLGINMEMLQGLIRNKKNLENFKLGDIISDAQAQRLSDVDVSLKNLWDSMKKFSGKEAAKHGLPLVEGLNDSFKLLKDAVTDTEKLIKNFESFKGIVEIVGAAIAVALAPITATAAAAIYLMAEMQKYREGKESLFGEKGTPPAAVGWGDNLMNFLDHKLGDFGDAISSNFANYKDAEENKLVGKQSTESAITPRVNNRTPQSTSTVNVTANVTHHGDAKDSRAVLDVHKKAIEQAVRQSPALRRVD